MFPVATILSKMLLNRSFRSAKGVRFGAGCVGSAARADGVGTGAGRVGSDADRVGFWSDGVVSVEGGWGMEPDCCLVNAGMLPESTAIKSLVCTHTCSNFQLMQ